MKLHQLLQPRSLLEAKIVAESRQLAENLREKGSGNCPITDFAVALGAATANLSCRVVLRKVTDTQQYWSKSMNNTFVVCVLPGASGKPIGLIVDPSFKEQFGTAHMTERYRDIWSSLPMTFVGQVAQLMPLVQVLCYELSLMFESLGTVLPPWRSYNAYVSRWISKTCADSVVPLASPGRPPSKPQVLSLSQHAAHVKQQEARRSGAAESQPNAQLYECKAISTQVIRGFHVRPSELRA